MVSPAELQLRKKAQFIDLQDKQFSFSVELQELW